MVRIRDIVSTFLVALIATQAVLLVPGAGSGHTHVHQDGHDRAVVDHAEPTGACCPDGTLSLQGPCDTAGPCTNPRHHHHEGSGAHDPSPCTQCLRTAATGDSETIVAGPPIPARIASALPTVDPPSPDSRLPLRYQSRAPPDCCINA